MQAAEFGVTDLGRQLNAAKNALAVAKAEFLKVECRLLARGCSLY